MNLKTSGIIDDIRKSLFFTVPPPPFNMLFINEMRQAIIITKLIRYMYSYVIDVKSKLVFCQEKNAEKIKVSLLDMRATCKQGSITPRRISSDKFLLYRDINRGQDLGEMESVYMDVNQIKHIF